MCNPRSSWFICEVVGDEVVIALPDRVSLVNVGGVVVVFSGELPSESWSTL